jgi:hypothetical protein
MPLPCRRLDSSIVDQMLEQISYRGWNNAYRISNRNVQLFVLADVGPRIIWYGPIDGENVLHEVGADAGRTGGREFRLYGGHRLWIWPEVPRTYFPDNQAVTVTQHGRLVRFSAPIEGGEPGTNLQKELEIELATAGTQVTLKHRVINHDKSPTTMAVWAPTVMRPGGRAILPLPPRATMDQDHFQSVGPMTLWSFTDLSDPRWVFGTEYIQLKQDVQPAGRFREQMTGIYNPAGWGAYFYNRTLFIKRAPMIAGASYPDFGCNFEVFTNPEFLELETLGPKLVLQPGEETTHLESWELFKDVPSGEDEDWIRSAVSPLVASK